MKNFRNPNSITYDGTMISKTHILGNHSLSFDSNIAKFFGLHIAILYNHFLYWLKHNHVHSPEECIFDGKVWMYTTCKKISNFFGLFGERAVQRAIKKMIEVGLLEKREDNSNPLKKKIWYTIKDQASVKIQKKINKSSDTKTPPVKKMFTYRTDVRHVPNHGSPPPIPPIKESIYINKINKDLIASNNTRAIPPNLEELPAKSLHDLLPQTKGIMNPERPVLTVQNSKREMLTVDEHKVRDYCLRQGFSQQIVSYAIEQLRKIKRPVNSIFTLAATICSRYRKDLKEQKQNEQQFEAKAHKTENSVAKNSIPKETIMENDRTRAINSMINKTVKEQRLKELESRKGSALLGPQIEKQFFHAVEMAKPPIEKALLLTVEEKKKRMAEALKQLEELKRLNNPPEETPIAQVVAQAPIEIGDYHEKPEWAENFL